MNDFNYKQYFACLNSGINHWDLKKAAEISLEKCAVSLPEKLKAKLEKHGIEIEAEGE